MSADLRRRRDFGEILRTAYRTYAAHFRALLLIALITAPLQMLLIVLGRRAESDGAQSALVLLQIPVLIVTIIAAAALIHAIDRIANGTPPDPGESIDAGFAFFTAVLGGNMMVVLLFLASFLAFPFLGIWWLFKPEATIDGRRDWWLIVPAVLPIYLVIRWTFFLEATVIEGKRHWPAFDASADIVRDSWWRTLGVLLGAAAVLIPTVLIAQSARLGPVWVEASVVPLVSALVLPFSIATHTLLYYDLKARVKSDVAAA